MTGDGSAPADVPAVGNHRTVSDRPRRVLRTAEEVGLDVARLQQDMESPEVTGQLEKNMNLADRLEIRGTPAFVIGDQLVPGAIPPATVRKMIADARKGTTGG